MKSIHVSQLKAQSFNLTSLMEEVVEIQETNINQTEIDLYDVISDLEGIKEALFFKKEKLNQKLRRIQDNIKLEKIDDLKLAVEKINLKPLGNSKEALEKNKEINQLKEVEKATKYLIEIDKGNFLVLDGLISSDDKEDWKFLCFFLKHVIDSIENQKELLKYKKLIEEKMIKVFEEGQKTKNKTVMKSAYNALYEMEQEKSLIQVYIYDLDLFKNIVEMKRKSVHSIDFDFYLSENSTFLELISKIRDTYETDFTELENIFINYTEVYKIIHKKVYDDILYNALKNFLDTAPASLFLLDLENCHKNIHILGSFIESIDPNFDSSLAAEDLISQYVQKAVDREKILFSEIYEILVNNGTTSMEYIILGSKVEKTNDYIFIYKQLLSLIGYSMSRCNRFYTESDEDELISFFFRKINGLVTTIATNASDNFEAIKILKFMYLVTRKFFGEKFIKLGFFSKKIETKIRNLFNDEINVCNYRTGSRIRDETFDDPKSVNNILDVLKGQISKANKGSIKGENYKIFVDKLQYFVYDALFKRIKSLVFTPYKGKNLLIYINTILEYSRKVGCTEAIQRFMYLKDICILITLPSSDFEMFYGTLAGKISNEELENIIQCRNDRNSGINISSLIGKKKGK